MLAFLVDLISGWIAVRSPRRRRVAVAIWSVAALLTIAVLIIVAKGGE